MKGEKGERAPVGLALSLQLGDVHTRRSPTVFRASHPQCLVQVLTWLTPRSLPSLAR